MEPIAYGSKYEATKDLDKAEIAKMIRKDIKAAYPRIKTSVRLERFAGGSSIDVSIRAVPFRVLDVARVLHDHRTPNVYPEGLKLLNQEGEVLISGIKAIVDEYNFDGSDIQSDYFHVRFYSEVRFDSAVLAAERAQILASTALEESAQLAADKSAADFRQNAAKIPVRSIVLKRNEGPQEECGKPIVLVSFAEATAALARWAKTAPDSGGYDKTDFKIEFEDGEIYEGRVDLQRKHSTGYDLAKHVRDFCSAYSGRTVPPTATPEAWAAIVAQTGKATEFARFLDSYDLASGQPEDSPEKSAVAEAVAAQSKLAEIARTRRPTPEETAEALRAYEKAAATEAYRAVGPPPDLKTCGWCDAGILVLNGNEIQSCDECKLFETDEDAAVVVKKLLGLLDDAYNGAATVSDAFDLLVEKLKGGA